ncbi:MAG: LIC11966 family surface protein [Bacteroidota bacterium]
MKKIFLLFLPVFISFSSFCQKFESAREYNDFVILQQEVIMVDLISYTHVMQATTNYDTLRSGLDNLIKITEISLSNVKKATPYSGGKELKNAVIDLFTFYIKAFKNEFSEMIKVLSKAQITEADAIKVQQLADKVAEDEKKYDDAFQKAQNKFAADNNLEIVPNQLQKEIDELNK